MTDKIWKYVYAVGITVERVESLLDDTQDVVMIPKERHDGAVYVPDYGMCRYLLFTDMELDLELINIDIPLCSPNTEPNSDLQAMIDEVV